MGTLECRVDGEVTVLGSFAERVGSPSLPPSSLFPAHSFCLPHCAVRWHNPPAFYPCAWGSRRMDPSTRCQ